MPSVDFEVPEFRCCLPPEQAPTCNVVCPQRTGLDVSHAHAVAVQVGSDLGLRVAGKGGLTDWFANHTLAHAEAEALAARVAGKRCSTDWFANYTVAYAEGEVLAARVVGPALT